MARTPYPSDLTDGQWLGKYRRLSKDYETLTDSSQCMICITMINLMPHRLQPG